MLQHHIMPCHVLPDDDGKSDGKDTNEVQKDTIRGANAAAFAKSAIPSVLTCIPIPNHKGDTIHQTRYVAS